MKLKTIYSKTNNGLFGYIKALLDVSWFNDDKAKYLNTYYFLGHSGNKKLSPFIDDVITEYSTIDDNKRLVLKDYDIEVLSDDSLDNAYSLIAQIIVDTYKTKWLDTYEALTLKYDLERESSLSKTETPNITDTNDVTSNVASSDTESSYQGFNSTDYSPREKVATSSNGSNSSTSKHTGTNQIDSTFKGGDIATKVRKLVSLRETLINDIIINDIDKLIASPYYVY